MSRRFVYYGAGVAAANLLLDSYPATVAYSLRKLRTAYAGSAIRVRRSSDNTEIDIGFVGVDLDTASLLSFVGSSDGFVSIWYDQQGSNNATQATASNQLRVVNNGSLELINGLPTLKFFQGQSKMFMDSLSYLSEGEMFLSLKAENDPGAINNRSWKFGTSTFDNHHPFTNASIYDDFGSTSRRLIGDPITNLTNAHVYNILSANNDVRAWINNEALSTFNSNVVSFNNSPVLGSYNATAVAYNNFFELIIYPLKEDVNRGNIKQNIFNYYGI